MNVFDKLLESIATSRMGYRRKLLYLKRLIWAQEKNIKQKEKDILSKYCGIKKEDNDKNDGLNYFLNHPF